MICGQCGRDHGHPEKWQHALQADGTYRCTGRPAKPDSVVSVAVGEDERIAVLQPEKRGRKEWRTRAEYNAYMREYMRKYRKGKNG